LMVVILCWLHRFLHKFPKDLQACICCFQHSKEKKIHSAKFHQKPQITFISLSWVVCPSVGFLLNVLWNMLSCSTPVQSAWATPLNSTDQSGERDKFPKGKVWRPWWSKGKVRQ
jgi:hypothetical protein